MAAITLSVLAEKGGVGKTTILLNTAAVLAELGYRVLTIDGDKQGNLTKFYLGVANFENIPTDSTLAALFDDRFDPEPGELVQGTKTEGVFLLPATRQLKHYLYVDEVTYEQTKFAVRDFLDEAHASFDVVLIDTPPDIDSMATKTALLASDYVITPVEPEAFSAQGVRGGDIAITEAMQDNNTLRFLGYVINKLDLRRSDQKVFEEKLRNHYSSQVFETVLRYLSPFAQSEALQQSVTQMDGTSKASKLVKDLVQELLTRMEQAGAAPSASETDTRREAA